MLSELIVSCRFLAVPLCSRARDALALIRRVDRDLKRITRPAGFCISFVPSVFVFVYTSVSIWLGALLHQY